MPTTSYLGSVFNDPANYSVLIDHVAAHITSTMARSRFRLKNYAIAFQGNSGAALAFPVAAKLQKPLICVRKANDSSHFRHMVEYGHAASLPKNVIIIDDFIDTGDTLRRIVTAVEGENIYAPHTEAAAPLGLKVRAVFLYNKYSDNDWNGIPTYGVSN
ncbi:MAG: hypothetical protein GY906_23135 [bacterium]|nr:hypothetical protein [bacterium]